MNSLQELFLKEEDLSSLLELASRIEQSNGTPLVVDSRASRAIRCLVHLAVPSSTVRLWCNE